MCVIINKQKKKKKKKKKKRKKKKKKKKLYFIFFKKKKKKKKKTAEFIKRPPTLSHPALYFPSEKALLSRSARARVCVYIMCMHYVDVCMY